MNEPQSLTPDEFVKQLDPNGVLACPVIIGPLAMLGFLDTGGTDERQAI